MGNIPAVQSATSQDSASGSNEDWWLRQVERIFQKFEDWYLAKWAASFGGLPRARVKQTWADELRGFADKPECIAQAMKAQRNNPFPPTLPEFLSLCNEAAKRVGDSAPLALTHKLTPEDIERNRKRAADLIAVLAKAKRMPGPFRD